MQAWLVQGRLTADLEMEISLQTDGSHFLFFGSNVPDEVDPNQLHTYSVWKRKFVITLDQALAFVENCGSFVLEQIQELLTPTADNEVSGNLKTGTQFLTGITFMFDDLICGIDAIEAERDVRIVPQVAPTYPALLRACASSSNTVVS